MVFIASEYSCMFPADWRPEGVFSNLFIDRRALGLWWLCYVCLRRLDSADLTLAASPIPVPRLRDRDPGREDAALRVETVKATAIHILAGVLISSRLLRPVRIPPPAPGPM